MEEIARWLVAERPGPLVVTGEPGSGRTSLLTHAVGLTDPARDRVVVVRPRVCDFAAVAGPKVTTGGRSSRHDPTDEAVLKFKDNRHGR